MAKRRLSLLTLAPAGPNPEWRAIRPERPRTGIAASASGWRHPGAAHRTPTAASDIYTSFRTSLRSVTTWNSNSGNSLTDVSAFSSVI